MESILKTTKKGKEVRILRPSEYKLLYEAASKDINRDKLDALLYTGARYNELRELFKHPKWLKSSSIRMPSMKKKAKFLERYIRLNNQGIRAIQYYLKGSPLPSYSTFNENLCRWAKKAGIDTTGLTCKTFRKTWESWLVACFPESLPQIFLSQGHTEMISLKYYLMIPFTDKDKDDMKIYTEGWL